MAEIRTWYPTNYNVLSEEVKGFIESEKFYVRNKTEPIGRLLLSFVEQQSGRSYLAEIPRTSLPIHLSAFAPPQAILSSMNLRDLLRKRVVEVVHPSEAEKILADPTVQEELDILYNRRKVPTERIEVVPYKGPEIPDSAAHEAFVNPRVLSVVAQLQDSNIGAKDAHYQIKAMESTLSNDDLAYIINHAPEGLVKTYAKKLLASKVQPGKGEGQGLSGVDLEIGETVALP